MIYNSQDFYGNNYNIKHAFNSIKWNYSSKEEVVYGYKCKIATFISMEEDRNGNEIEDVTTVWYSDQVSSNSIPFGLTGLPGGIVKINFNGFTEAVLITQRLGEKNEKIKPLRKGKIVSLDEFEKMESEYSQKRDEMYRGNVDKD